MAKEKEPTPEAPVAAPKVRSHHTAAFNTKEEFAAFLEKVKQLHPDRWERQKAELEAALESFT